MFILQYTWLDTIHAGTISTVYQANKDSRETGNIILTSSSSTHHLNLAFVRSNKQQI